MTRIEIPFGNAYDMGSHIWLAWMRVPAAMQGRGVGTMIVQDLQKRGKPIILEAEPDDGCAANLARFYERMGFRSTHNKNLPTQLKWTPCTKDAKG